MEGGPAATSTPAGNEEKELEDEGAADEDGEPQQLGIHGAAHQSNQEIIEATGQSAHSAAQGVHE